MGSTETENPCLLLVEDDPASRTALARLLGLNGWNVQTAEDGAEAVRMMQAGIRPDIILTDYLMPHLDGLALLRHIRSESTLPSPPAVMMTALELPADIHAEFDASVRKPFRLGELQSVLEDLARQRASGPCTR